MFGSQVVLKELKSLAQRIAENIRRNGQTASGRSERSLVVEDEGESIALYGRKYFGTLETGRRPIGDVKPSRSFVEILYQWSIDKRISFGNDRERWSFAYALGRSIHKQGTLLHQQGGRADVYSNEIPQAVENINKSLASALSARIIEGIKLNTDERTNN